MATSAHEVEDETGVFKQPWSHTAGGRHGPPSRNIQSWSHHTCSAHARAKLQNSFGNASCVQSTWNVQIKYLTSSAVQGVQQNCLHLVICSFVGFYSCKLQKLGHFWKIQEICYMIGTRILKIDLEIAEIIEVKGNHHLEIYILLWHRGRKIISMLKMETLTSSISAFSESIFKILVPIT